MEKLELDEVKKIQLEILDFVASFCDENRIHYWIDSGTLLGAIRHKGYIPWDDDIDIGMLREDYDRFMKIFNKGNQKYRYICVQNDPAFRYLFGKVIDSDTILYEPDKNGYRLAVNIDVFVYDNAPDNDFLVKEMYFKRDLWILMAGYSRNNQIHLSDSTVKKLIKKIMHGILSSFPQDFFIKRGIKNSKKYASIRTQRVGNFTSVTKFVCDKKVFADFMEVEFENKMYKAPIGYDEWLTSYYGNYMELPPVEKRVSNHKFEAYRKELCNLKDDLQ